MKRTALFLALGFVVGLSGCGQKSYVLISEIERAPEFVSERHLEFSGVPRLDLVGSYSWRAASVGQKKSPGAGKKQHRYVIPVVPNGWNKSQAVPLWVSFSYTKRDQKSAMGALKAALSAGRIRGQNVDFPERISGVVRGKSAWQSAVEDAERRHGIVSDSRAPIVSWRPQG